MCGYSNPNAKAAAGSTSVVGTSTSPDAVSQDSTARAFKLIADAMGKRPTQKDPMEDLLNAQSHAQDNLMTRRGRKSTFLGGTGLDASMPGDKTILGG